MSQKELHRMHVVRMTLEGRESVGRGAKLLGISPRQMKRLRRKMKEHGVAGLLHGSRGKPARNKTDSEQIAQVLHWVRGRYRGLNDTHLTEKLKEQEKINLSRSTVRVMQSSRTKLTESPLLLPSDASLRASLPRAFLEGL
ncbi:MAG: helix-turn-helix domain-containing protein [Candidatus Binatia bacterium]